MDSDHGHIAEEIRQTKPFPNLETEAYLTLVLTAVRLVHDVSTLLQPNDLSPPQYNLLRILRGAGEKGLLCNEIAARMVHPVSDITRLLERLERRGWIRRRRETDDRRAVRVWITETGQEIIAPLDTLLAQKHKAQFGHLGENKLHELIKILDNIRKHLPKTREKQRP
jgi:DNA-binding MarR family transcriptional regulator